MIFISLAVSLLTLLSPQYLVNGKSYSQKIGGWVSCICLTLFQKTAYSLTSLLNLGLVFLPQKWYDMRQKDALQNYSICIKINVQRIKIMQMKGGKRLLFISLNETAVTGNEAHLSVMIKIGSFSNNTHLNIWFHF